MTARTPEQAQEALCPFARTFAAPKAEPGCRGPSCALWRWQEISAEHRVFVAAVGRLMDEGKTHRVAVNTVSSDRAAYGVPTAPTHGFCGMGG